MSVLYQNVRIPITVNAYRKRQNNFSHLFMTRDLLDLLKWNLCTDFLEGPFFFH